MAREIDAETGRLANEWCPVNVVTEYFIAGTEPAEACSPYRGGLFGAPLRGLTPDSTPRDTLRQDTLRRDTIRRDSMF
ncbi:MAG: hypothetical protein ACREK1_09145 [Longimicrobiales bacterium]